MASRITACNVDSVSVIEGVPTEFTGGLEDRGRDGSVLTDRTGRKQGPQHLGGQGHRPGARLLYEPVAERTFGSDHHGEDGRDRPAAFQQRGVERSQVDADDSQAFHAVDERKPDDQFAAVGVLYTQGHRAEGPACQ
ncbi:hypothetical protein OG770_36020 [Streptomyces sp. NBC_01185]|nr:hypothetical protein OG770_36020 [Streptomyces sp. NBC_01185]